MIVGLILVLALVLVLPFAVHRIERNLELFLFVMGLAAAGIARVFSAKLVHSALVDPIAITVAVLGMGLLFKYSRQWLERGVTAAIARMPVRLFVFLTILLLGLVSSVITVIVASLVLVEVVSILRLQRKAEVRVVILACYALGLGAVLTPIGEPLSTIATLKLAGEPYHADFWFLMRLLGPWIVPGVLLFAGLSFCFRAPPTRGTAPEATLSAAPLDETLGDVVWRAVKVYVFVMALVLLGVQAAVQ